MTAKIVLLATTSLLLGACDVLDIGQACTLEARPAITVRLLDATTGESPAADTGRIVVRDGVYADSATVSSFVFEQDVRIGLAHERRGAYSVEVEVPGYERWTTDDVHVGQTDDGCHVDTELVTAELQPSSDAGE
ncbi:MAG: hypothetical protein ACREKM_08640 [Longimicrobiales bacterium]